jgi:hypothetical protein
MSQTQMQEIEGTNRSPNETFGDVFRPLSRRSGLGPHRRRGAVSDPQALASGVEWQICTFRPPVPC